MHDEDDEPVDEDEIDEADWNGHTLSIRRSDGQEVVTIQSPNEEWNVHLQPGGAITNAFLGTNGEPIVWVEAVDRRVERDEDGTYVIRIN